MHQLSSFILKPPRTKGAFKKIMIAANNLILKSKFNRKGCRRQRGAGFVNSLINKLPFELHLPRYSYCGPGTKLEERLKRGDPGINKLDEACKDHDIAYSKHSDLENRHLADRELTSKAFEIFRSPNAKLSERAAALGVGTIMKAKTKLGMGMAIRRKKRVGGALTLHTATKLAKQALKRKKTSNNLNNMKNAIKIAINAIKTSGKRGKKKITSHRVIPVPKIGGFLPLIPIFAGLSALGALSGGAAGIAKAITAAKTASDQLKEAQRHNRTMESIAIGKGLYLKPYKTGLGLFLGPQRTKRIYR